MEDSQFEQAVQLKELGVPIPDDILIENSRLARKGEIAKRIRDAANSPEAQKAADQKNRMAEAEIASKEGEALSKTTKAKLEQAKAETEQGQDGGAQAEANLEMFKAEKEMELARFKAEEEIKLKREVAMAELEIKRQVAEADAMQKRAQAAAIAAHPKEAVGGGDQKKPAEKAESQE
jgi:hypothetical protein